MRQQQPIDTAERVKRQYKKYSYLKHLYDNLHRAGIPWYRVHYYRTPSMTSGYLGGELIRVYCKGELLDEYDNVTKQGNAHGVMVYEFPTTQALRDYIEQCEQKNDHHNDFSTRYAAMLRRRKMELMYINYEKSKINDQDENDDE